MAAENSEPGEILDIRPFEGKLGKARTKTLIKTERLEVVRLVVLAGREIPSHQAPGDLIVQCLEGEVSFTALGKTSKLKPGELVHLPARVPHALKAKYDSSLLVTMVFGG